VPSALIIKPTGTWTVTYFALHQMMPEFFTARGKINSDAVEALHLIETTPTAYQKKSFAAGTLLFNAPTITPGRVLYKVDSSGELTDETPYYRVDLEILVNENGWNTFIRPDSGVAARLQTESGGTYTDVDFYQTADLNILLGRA
jgi:hypothetical protein